MATEFIVKTNIFYEKPMKNKNSSIRIQMVSILDGFIGKKDGSVSWMRSIEQLLHLKDVTVFKDGIVELRQEI